MSTEAENSSAPPLRPVVFSILLALSREKLHGYAVMQAVNARMGQRVVVGPGTLYRTLKELQDTGWIELAGTPAGEDGRRRYYRLTRTGRRVAAEEASRMASLVDDARAADLIPEGGPGR